MNLFIIILHPLLISNYIHYFFLKIYSFIHLLISTYFFTLIYHQSCLSYLKHLILKIKTNLILLYHFFIPIYYLHHFILTGFIYFYPSFLIQLVNPIICFISYFYEQMINHSDAV
jgi:hypothetical protein